MKMFKLKQSLVPVYCSLLLVMIAVPSTLRAATATLQDLFDGQDLVVGHKIFTGWSLEDDFSSIGIDYADIDVTGNVPSPLSAELWFDTSRQFIVDNGDFIDVKFSFTVIDTRLQIIGAGLNLGTNTITGDAFVIIDESIFGPGPALIAEMHVEKDPFFGTDITEDISKFDRVSSIIVEKEIFLDSNFFGTAQLDGFHQTFSEIPLPGAIYLFSIGLLGLLGLGRQHPR